MFATTAAPLTQPSKTKRREILRLTDFIRDNHKSTITGDLGEELFTKMLAPHWKCKKPLECNEGDFTIVSRNNGEKLQVEVKTAKRDKKGHYQFCLRKDDKHGKTDYHDSQLVVLFCIDVAGNAFAYLIPTPVMTLKKITISCHPTRYTGKYSKWLQRGLEISPELAFEIQVLSQWGQS